MEFRLGLYLNILTKDIYLIVINVFMNSIKFLIVLLTMMGGVSTVLIETYVKILMGVNSVIIIVLLLIQCLKYFSSENNITPREIFLNSSKKYIFDCNTCDNQFKIKLYNVNNGRWCSFCKKKTETKFMKWFEKSFKKITLENQPLFDWCKNIKKLPFDFKIVIFNLLIEVDGIQHFKQVSNWQYPTITQQRDVYKMKRALKNNYSIIRISQEDIWYDRYDWQKEITQCIKKYDTPQIIYLSKNKDLYNEHKQLLFINNLLDNLIDEFITIIITKYL